MTGNEKEKEIDLKDNESIFSKVSTFFHENKNDLVLMKKGDYTVHILIEEIKNLLSRKKGSPPLPIIKVTCFNKTQRTSKPPQECEAYTFNEHLYFEKTNLSVDELDSSKILIEVYDYHDSEKEYYFGIQEFDFEYIYSKENHCMKNVWIALANPAAKDITKVNGYLKLSINICSTEDEKIELNPDQTVDSDYILPSQIKTTYKQMEIYIFSGEGFPKMKNFFGKNEFNVEVKYLGISKSTQIVKMENEKVEWNELIEIPVAQPVISQKVIFLVKHKNKDLVGSLMLTIDDIKNGKYKELNCMDIYGSIKPDDNSQAAKMMNENPELGSSWKGRILLIINYRDKDSPNAGVQRINDRKLIESVNNKGRGILWYIYFKLYSASFLPSEDGSYDIGIYIQENKYNYIEQKAEKRNIYWNYCNHLNANTFTNNLEELPDIIIYLRQKEQVICFQRIKLSKFYLNDKLHVIKLYPEPCIGAVKELYYSGIVKMKINLFNSKDKNAESYKKAFKDGDEYETERIDKNNKIIKAKELSDSEDEDLQNVLYEPEEKKIVNENVEKKKKNFKFYKVVVCVYMTRYLISGDSSGLSDPYCTISINGDEKKTSTKYKCVNGIWNEKLIFENVGFSYNEQATWPIIFATVMNENTILSNEMLGYSYIWLIDTAYSLNKCSQNIKPRWHQLYLKKSNKAQGQILLSCYIISENAENIIQNENDINPDMIQITPDTIEYRAEINALGLRDLKPLSFINIKKPYISFDLNSINVSDGINIDPVTTIPNDSGPNPNITSIISFNLKLPEDDKYIPEFQCDVYDHVLGGLSKRILGIFLIDLIQIIEGTKKHYKLEKDEAKKVMEILDKKENKNKSKPKEIKGMSEKEEFDDNINRNSKEDFLLEQDNDINNNLIDTNIEIEKKEQEKNINITKNTFLCNFPSELKSIYKGPIDNSLLEKEKDNSEYFVIKPSFKEYPLSKKMHKKFKQLQIKDKENGMVELEKVGEEEQEEENLIEDESYIPNKDLFFPIGFNKNDNPLKYIETGEIKNMLGEIEVKNDDDDEEKEGLIKKNDIKITNNKKHYRRIYRKELEYVKELDLGAPFIKFHLVRNKYEDQISSLSSVFDAIKNENNKILRSFDPKIIEKKKRLKAIQNLRMNYIETKEELMRTKNLLFDSRYYGYFKALMRLAPLNEYTAHKNFIEGIKKKYNGKLPEELTFLTAFEDFGKTVVVKRSLIVRVYILELNNLAKRDTFSESDPYIKIFLGEKLLVDERQKHFNDSKNCKWYQYYDLKIELPGSSKLRIQVMDYDKLFTDDLIGETSIDIEDRYFDNRWQALRNKPIEVRKLYHPDFETPQGEVSMWLEMFNQDEQDYKMEPWNIEPEPKNSLEMRLIIYETDIADADHEEVCDIYVKAYIEGKDKEQTDVHYRCQDGNGNFNWRMLIPIEIPRDKYYLTIQIFDRDIFSKDDFICGGRINLYEIINDVNLLDLPIKLNPEYFSSLSEEKQKKISNIEFVIESEDKEDPNKFWVQLEKQGKEGGKVLCSLEIVPDWYSTLYRVGKGRSEPNINPHLLPPVGRISFTLNPFKILNQFTGPTFRRKFYKRLCTCLCVICIFFSTLSITLKIFCEFMNPFNYAKLFKK